MNGRRWLARAGLVLALASAVALVGGTGASGRSDPGDSASTSAQQHNRAVVVIDDGTRRTATCVTFPEPEISGLDALRRAGASVEAQQFGTMGGAVCSINGVGCPLTGCLTCQAPAYWNYFRAVGGGGFVRWGTGASTAKVRDGDVEGWAWGAAPSAPSLPTVDQVCGIRPAPPAPTPVPQPAPPSAPANPSSPSAGGSTPAAPGSATADLPGRLPTDGAATGDASTTTAPDGDATTTTAAPEDERAGADDGDGTEADDLEILDADEMAAVAAAAERDDDGGGPPWASLLAFVVLAALVAGGFFFVRHQRQGADDAV